MAQMIKITQAFATANHLTAIEDGKNYFGCNETTSGDYFCDPESLNTHPNLFSGQTIEYIEVRPEDVDDDPMGG